MFGERLSDLRKERKLTQNDLAEIIGVAKTTLSSYEQNKRMPDVTLQYAIADYFKVSLDYLHGRTNVRDSSNLKRLDTNDLINIPIVGTIKCGPGGIIYEDIEGFSSYPKSDIDSSHEYIVLNAKGDSMIGDGINDGDLALIQKEPEFVQGKIYAVLLDSEEVTLKRVTKTEDSVILSPSNPKYDTRVVTGSDLESFNIIGRLINIKRNYF